MKKPTIGIVVGTACLAALALWQHSLSQRLAKLDATLDRIADRLDVSGGEDEPPRFIHQVRAAAGLSKDELRAILREELLALQGAAPATAPGEEAPSKAPPPPPSPESVHAFQGAQRLVQDAVSARVWTEKDATEMRLLMPQLTPDQLDQIRTTLFPAVNSQQVRVEVVGPLF